MPALGLPASGLPSAGADSVPELALRELHPAGPREPAAGPSRRSPARARHRPLARLRRPRADPGGVDLARDPAVERSAGALPRHAGRAGRRVLHDAQVPDTAARRHEPRRAAADPADLLRAARVGAPGVLAAPGRAARPDRVRAGAARLRDVDGREACARHGVDRRPLRRPLPADARRHWLARVAPIAAWGGPTDARTVTRHVW